MELACSTSSRIFETVDSPNAFSTRILITPFVLMQPLIALSWIVICRGTDSPVRADVSIKAVPSITVPSRGIFSPVLTTIVSPILMLEGVFWMIFPSASILA